MTAAKKGIRKVCKLGHVFYKSSDCPSCPQCEGARAPQSGFLAELSAPARRALEGLGIKTLAQLAKRTEKELLAKHGFGPASLPQLRRALSDEGRAFKK